MESLCTRAYRMTAAEFAELPEGPPYFQLIDGDLYMSPSPRRYHQKLSARLAHLLMTYLDDHPLGDLYTAPSDVVFTDETVLNPDIYFVSHARAGILTEQGATGAPDLVVEILSPSTAKLDAGRKREIYAASGVAEMWIVVPKTKSVEVFRFAENQLEPVAAFASDDVLTSPLFPGWSLAIDKLFGH